MSPRGEQDDRDDVSADPTAPAGPAGAVYRIDDLAHRSGATVRTIRAYQDRGLLPSPERRGRANVYSDAHLTRLRRIADLLDRGYTLASIKELLDAWDTGRGLGGVLGLASEVECPWTDEQAVRISRAELVERFGGAPDEAAVADAIDLGVLVPVPDEEHMFLVPSPQELAVAVELHSAGVPLAVMAAQLRELRAQVEHIAVRFLEFTTEHIFTHSLEQHRPPTETDAAALVRRLRPLAQQSVDAELARAIRLFSTRRPRRHLDSDMSGEPEEDSRSVLIAASTMRAVERLVGPEQVSAFVTAAAEREVQSRTLDTLTANKGEG